MPDGSEFQTKYKLSLCDLVFKVIGLFKLFEVKIGKK